MPLTTNTAYIFLWSIDKKGTIMVTQGSMVPIELKNNLNPPFVDRHEHRFTEGVTPRMDDIYVKGP